MNCVFCGVLSSIGSVAARRWRDRVRRAGQSEAEPQLTMWQVHRLQDGASQGVGDSVHARSADAQGELFYNSDV